MEMRSLAEPSKLDSFYYYAQEDIKKNPENVWEYCESKEHVIEVLNTIEEMETEELPNQHK